MTPKNVTDPFWMRIYFVCVQENNDRWVASCEKRIENWRRHTAAHFLLRTVNWEYNRRGDISSPFSCDLLAYEVSGNVGELCQPGCRGSWVLLRYHLAVETVSDYRHKVEGKAGAEHRVPGTRATRVLQDLLRESEGASNLQYVVKGGVARTWHFLLVTFLVLQCTNADSTLH